MYSTWTLQVKATVFKLQNSLNSYFLPQAAQHRVKNHYCWAVSQTNIAILYMQ